jgi:Flp pilus assembly pilin Flp
VGLEQKRALGYPSSVLHEQNLPLKKVRRSGCAGQGMTEYIIIVILVAIVILVCVRMFGSSVGNQFSAATDEISTLGNGENQGGEAVGSGKTGGNHGGPGGESNGGGGSGGGKESGSGGAESGKAENDSLRANSVGDSATDQLPSFSWGKLLPVAGLVIGLGIFVVLMGMKKAKGKGGKKEKKKKKKSLFKRNQSGQAMVEFVFVAITFLFVILGIIQLALVLNAYALTRYAAYNAARAAIVHGGDVDKMKEAARISLLSVFPSHGRADHLKGLTENYLAAKATDDDTNFYTYTVRINGSNVTKSEKITEVKILDNRGVTSGETVTFDDPKQAPKGLITVQVTHRYELVIPLVNRILFYVYQRYESGDGYDNESLDNLSHETDKMRRSGGLSGEFRYPLVAHYTMRLQSDYLKP